MKKPVKEILPYRMGIEFRRNHISSESVKKYNKILSKLPNYTGKTGRRLCFQFPLEAQCDLFEKMLNDILEKDTFKVHR